jgi:hypothetical protein
VLEDPQKTYRLLVATAEQAARGFVAFPTRYSWGAERGHGDDLGLVIIVFRSSLSHQAAFSH